MSSITTLLIDVGGPVVIENEAEKAWHNRLKMLVFEHTGKALNDYEIEHYLQDAVRCYAPSVFSYVIWQAVKPDKGLFYRLREEFDRFPLEEHFKFQPCIKELLAKLQRHFRLGIAANQNEGAFRFLEKAGILEFFDFKKVSEQIGFSKPDVRHFLAIMDALGSRPDETAMIGDRQDNDIVPAKLLGMKAIRLLTGINRNQMVRYPKEEADYTVETIEELLEVPFIREKMQKQ